MNSLSANLSFQSLLNAYFLETGNFQIQEVDSSFAALTKEFWGDFEGTHRICSELPLFSIKIHAGLKYWALVGQHRYSFPILLETVKGEVFPIDHMTFAGLMAKQLEWDRMQSTDQAHEKLLSRLAHSRSVMDEILELRKQDEKKLFAVKTTCGEAEQALLVGHPLHPTPKSRVGINEDEILRYSPETKGKFPLFYFKVPSQYVVQDSALANSASELIKNELLEDSTVSSRWKEEHLYDDSFRLLPVHPWEASYLMRQPHIQKKISEGKLTPLGEVGHDYLPTCSVRTLFSSQSSFMPKFSLDVEITNSKRTNLKKELLRGKEAYEIFASSIGEDIAKNHPGFHCITDPAYIGFADEDGWLNELGTSLRQNPFKGAPETNVAMIASLCQDNPWGGSSRLKNILSEITRLENRPSQEVAKDWFGRYLDISLDALVGIYFKHGLAFEAHQQNTLLSLDDDLYPERFYYRDNQGIFHRDSAHENLCQVLPGLGEESESLGPEWLVDERLTYYFVINNLFGVVNALGATGLVSETLLFRELKARFVKLLDMEKEYERSFVSFVLNSEKLPFKGNLLTRFHEMDELIGDPATQSVYVHIPNPIYLDPKEVQDA